MAPRLPCEVVTGAVKRAASVSTAGPAPKFGKRDADCIVALNYSQTELVSSLLKVIDHDETVALTWSPLREPCLQKPQTLSEPALLRTEMGLVTLPQNSILKSASHLDCVGRFDVHLNLNRTLRQWSVV